MTEPERRIDLLTAETLALRLIVDTLVNRLPEAARRECLDVCLETLDALSANPGATHRGHQAFEDVRALLGQIVRVAPGTGARPRPDD